MNRITHTGKMSTFGGPKDKGVSPSEGLALTQRITPDLTYLFLPDQPKNTTGLARRLDPTEFYIAMRWDYKELPKSQLIKLKVQVLNPNTGAHAFAQPIDWGPHRDTKRIADLSPGLAKHLGLSTDDVCEVIVTYPS